MFFGFNHTCKTFFSFKFVDMAEIQTFCKFCYTVKPVKLLSKQLRRQIGLFLAFEATQHTPKGTCATPGSWEDKLGAKNKAKHVNFNHLYSSPSRAIW